MPTYTVTLVSDQVRDWNSTKGGPMKGYRVDLQDASGQVVRNCEWSRKPESPAPQVGQSVEGDIDLEAQYGPKFKLAQSAGFGGGGSRARPPEERRSIAMQHAQKCAVTILEVAAAHGEYHPPSAGDVAAQVKLVAATLFKQVQEAEGGATQ